MTSTLGLARSFRMAAETLAALGVLVGALSLGGVAHAACPTAPHPTLTANTTYYVWDCARRLTMVISPTTGTGSQVATQYIYDADSQLLETDKATVTSPYGSGFSALETTTYLYDAGGNKVQTNVLNGGPSAMTLLAITNNSYDADDRATCSAVRMNLGVTPPSSACTQGTASPTFGPDLITQTVYCDGGVGALAPTCAVGKTYQELRAVGTPLVQTYQTITYTSDGKPASITDARNNAFSMTYDGYDRLITTTFADATTEKNQYDLNGNVLAWTNRGAFTVVRGYDNLNRKICEEGLTGATVTTSTCVSGGSGGTPNQTTRWWDFDTRSFAYDLMGHMTAAKDTSLTWINYAWSYDNAGRPATYTDPWLVQTYTLDPVGNLLQFSSLGGLLRVYQYDALNRMTNAQLQRAGVDSSPIPDAAISYDSLGRRSVLTFADTSTETYVYDNADRPTSIAHAFPSYTADNVTYAYAYDPAGRDYSKTISNSLYQYAAAGASTTYATADSLNRYPSVAGASTSYWPEGHISFEPSLVSGGLSNYYDEFGNLRYQNDASSDVAQPYYDPLGRWLQRQTSNPSTGAHGNPAGTDTVVQGSYDGLHPETVAEWVFSAPNPATSWTFLGWRQYVLGPNPDERLAFVDLNQAIYYPHVDRAGSTIALSTTGYAVATHAYGPYGETPDPVTIVGTGASAYPYRYTGQRYDSAFQLYNYKARVYSPTLGRFYQTDPIGYEADLNLYGYVGDDPTNRTDSSGRFPDPMAGIDVSFRVPSAKTATTVGEVVIRAARRAAPVVEQGFFKTVTVVGHLNIIIDILQTWSYGGGLAKNDTTCDGAGQPSCAAIISQSDQKPAPAKKPKRGRTRSPSFPCVNCGALHGGSDHDVPNPNPGYCPECDVKANGGPEPTVYPDDD